MRSVERAPRVYVVQRPAVRNRRTGEWEDKFDMSPAKEHGGIVYLLPPGNVSRSLDETVARLDHRLSDIAENDHLLLAGDPVAIAATVLVASRHSPGPLSLLKWDRIDHCYYPYVLDVPNSG